MAWQLDRTPLVRHWSGGTLSDKKVVIFSTEVVLKHVRNNKKSPRFPSVWTFQGQVKECLWEMAITSHCARATRFPFHLFSKALSIETDRNSIKFKQHIFMTFEQWSKRVGCWWNSGCFRLNFFQMRWQRVLVYEWGCGGWAVFTAVVLTFRKRSQASASVPMLWCRCWWHAQGMAMPLFFRALLRAIYFNFMRYAIKRARSFSFQTSRGYCDDPGADLGAESFVIVFVTTNFFPCRKWPLAGSDNSTWVPFLVFQFLLTDPEADHVFQGFFQQTKWSTIHDVNTSLHWRLGEFQSKMKKMISGSESVLKILPSKMST